MKDIVGYEDIQYFLLFLRVKKYIRNSVKKMFNTYHANLYINIGLMDVQEARINPPLHGPIEEHEDIINKNINITRP